MRRLALALVLLLHAVSGAASELGPDGGGRHLHGKFIWIDLATEDPPAARAFYGAVFGWTFREAGSYTLIEASGRKVGGIFAHPRPRGAAVGSRWLSVVSVADVAAAAAYTRERGGGVLLAPRAIPGRGTHAVLRDPEGAAFGVLLNEGGDPPDTPVADGEVFWLDLFSRVPARAAAFYSGLATLDVDVGVIAGRDRTILSTRGVARAGISELPSGADRPGWLPYILVPDVAATLERVRAAGGRIVAPPRSHVLGGDLAIVADLSGGVVGIVSWEAR